MDVGAETESEQPGCAFCSRYWDPVIAAKMFRASALTIGCDDGSILEAYVQDRMDQFNEARLEALQTSECLCAFWWDILVEIISEANSVEVRSPVIKDLGFQLLDMAEEHIADLTDIRPYMARLETIATSPVSDVVEAWLIDRQKEHSGDSTD